MKRETKRTIVKCISGFISTLGALFTVLAICEVIKLMTLTLSLSIAIPIMGLITLVAGIIFVAITDYEERKEREMRHDY